jgi:hypothetical protein
MPEELIDSLRSVGLGTGDKKGVRKKPNQVADGASSPPLVMMMMNP